ncbi:UDP-3-O-(3-hydroxymyristoyl)glucosamine N-acyltransferase [Leptolyngbya sp. FACHB-16]|uniref:UDP-3-O-(3-hydroxymyristoyl)glucosamine N-acyltransferase n=1 Tax=unclassified Leptolyngbya TaxID=2650499 RepID=UPI00168387E9|nr:UDP-3-O-(3-hydroxymyristoyl)glucosamine N-acyltransferase [Leptolyngbya sp. FACHB-16]MBD2156089.1 UDP-3-O-(3-hydroxymyristoyl)glucosamine N-acyltransferase [Leptolyngbya sp. FACHB-16]
MKFSEVVQQLGAVDGSSLDERPDLNPEISGVSAIESPVAGTLSYIESRKYKTFLKTTIAQGLILPMDREMQQQALAHEVVWIGSRNPRLLFAEAIALFYKPFQPAPGIHPTAIIDPSVKLGRDVSIGAYVVIQPDVVIGDGVCIHPNVVIYPDVVIGDRTILHANCVIHEQTQIGRNCVIHSGAAIGSEGFGFVPRGDGTWFKMEQSGRTILEDEVEVGCNAAVDRPAVGETRVGARTKLDNLNQIGHDVKVGKDCIIPALAAIAGGVKIEDEVVLGGQVAISNRVVVGRGTRATMRSVIISNTEPGSVVSGHPAIPHQTWLRSSVLSSRLPETQQTIKDMQKQIAELQQQLAILQAQLPTVHSS